MFLDEEGKKSETGDEIRSIWKNLILGKLFIKLAAMKDFKKMKTMVEILNLCNIHSEATVKLI